MYSARRQGRPAAEALLQRLREERTSPTVLYYLRLPAKALRATEMGSLLLDLCEELKIPHVFDESFFKAVKEAARPLAPVSGSFFRVQKTKDGAIESFRSELQRLRAKQPDRKYLYLGETMPTCFQTLRGRSPGVAEHTDSLFVIHSAPENALRHAWAMLHLGHYTFNNALIPVCQIYEMRLSDSFLSGHCPDNRLAYIILDWELKESEVRGRLSGDEVHELAQQFPLWFYRQMHALGHVPSKSIVLATVKQKTRMLSGADVKHSCHVTFNVCGVPATHLQYVIRSCLAASAPHIKKFKTQVCSSAAFVDPKTGVDCIRDHPEVGLDLAAGITGNTGVAMHLSRKQPTDPYPALISLCAFSEGELHVFPRESGVLNPSGFHPPPVIGSHGFPEHDIRALTEDQAVNLMYQACCSVPKDNMVFPKSADQAEVKQIQTAFKPHAATSEEGPPARGGPRSAPSPEDVLPHLPAWFRDFLRANPKGEGRENARWASSYKNQIEKYNIQGADPSGWMVTRYQPDPARPGSGCPCPTHFSDSLSPSLYYHRSNAVILGANVALPGAVYARCSECSCCSATHADVDRVRSHDGIPTTWVKLVEDGFKKMMADLERRAYVHQRAEKVVNSVCKKIVEKKEFMEKATLCKRQKECTEKTTSRKIQKKMKN